MLLIIIIIYDSMKVWVKQEGALKVLAKTATYCVMHMIVAFFVAYAISQSWKIALSISLIEPAVQTIFFYFHERLWMRGLLPKPVRICGCGTHGR